MSGWLPAVGAPALAALLLCAAGCPEEGGADRPAYSRVAAVSAGAGAQTPAGWCDQYRPDAEAPTLSLPAAVAVGGGPAPAILKGRWWWVNLWATWCKPCLREMPLLPRWREAFGREGIKLDLVYLSIDSSLEDLKAFLASHRELIPPGAISLRLSDPSTDAEALAKWLTDRGLPEDQTIPIHLLVDPAGKLRCLRAGSISDSDFSIVEALLRGP